MLTPSIYWINAIAPHKLAMMPRPHGGEWLENPQKLMARIEGLRGGKLRGIDFPLQRVACANALP